MSLPPFLKLSISTEGLQLNFRTILFLKRSISESHLLRQIQQQKTLKTATAVSVATARFLTKVIMVPSGLTKEESQRVAIPVTSLHFTSKFTADYYS